MLIRLLLIPALVVLSAFFAAAELALVRSRRPRLEALAREGDRLASWALRAMSTTTRTLATSELGVVLASFAMGWMLAAIFARLPRGEHAGAAITAFVVVALIALYLQIVYGALAPRAAALARPERFARLLAPPLLVVSWIARPFVALVAISFQRLNQSIRAHAPPREAITAHSSDELRMLVEQSEEVGALEREDADLLEGVFEFSEKSAREVMTPRTEIVALPVTATMDETLRVVAESGFSRLPVYDDSIDDIVGVLIAKDLLPLVIERPARFDLRVLLRRVHFIPGTREVEDVLADFKRMGEHLAVVLDEYGGTAGIVTMEDLLEEIVGEIRDEHDEPAEPEARSRSGEILVAGEMNIGELNEQFGLAVPTTEHTTIGGFIFGTLGRLPRSGDRVSAGGGAFTVRAMDGRRVAQVAVELQPTHDGAPTQA